METGIEGVRDGDRDRGGYGWRQGERELGMETGIEGVRDGDRDRGS